MALSKLVSKCRACPYQFTCDHKEMEVVGFLPIPEGGLNSPDVEIRAGLNLTSKPDMCSEVTMCIADIVKNASRPFIETADELKHTMEQIAKECRYGKLG